MPRHSLPYWPGTARVALQLCFLRLRSGQAEPALRGRKSFFFFLILSLLLLACTKKEVREPRPIINFVGVSTGTLATDVNMLNFRDRFKTNDRELVGAASFVRVRDGTSVQATWFLPDEKASPLGRTTLKIVSGATIARFSIASKKPWKPAPYLLRIDTLSEKDNRVTASGTVQFFIGMKEKEIEEYRKGR